MNNRSYSCIGPCTGVPDHLQERQTMHRWVSHPRNTSADARMYRGSEDRWELRDETVGHGTVGDSVTSVCVVCCEVGVVAERSIFSSHPVNAPRRPKLPTSTCRRVDLHPVVGVSGAFIGSTVQSSARSNFGIRMAISRRPVRFCPDVWERPGPRSVYAGGPSPSRFRGRTAGARLARACPSR